MLVLSRKVDQKIMIGDDIEVVVASIHVGIYGRTVRLGINAPRDVPVYREEVYNQIRGREPQAPVHNIAETLPV